MASLLHIESGQQAWYSYYYSMHAYPSQSVWKVGSKIASSSSHSSNGISNFGLTGGGSVSILTYHSMSALLDATSRNLGVECFQPSMDISDELCNSSCLGSPSSVQVSGRTCHKSIQNCNSGYSLLDGGSLASHSSQNFGRHYLMVFCHKRLGAQGYEITAFNPLPAQRHLLQRHGFSNAICQV